ncbi:zinc finger protein 664 [Salmo trutta]|uniref:Zinc finger protein 664-like n=1 Tax=Salmo trutta TaxID=8032 RepID=A0A673XBA2_SALTR|nr:zinc finger protein 664-like [Salmo trutta]
MSKILLFRVFLNQRLTAAAEEIFEVVEQTIAEYQEECFRTKEENVRLQKLLDIVIKPEIKVHRADLQQLIVSKEEVPPEQQHCEKEWRPNLGQEVKEEQEELRTNQGEEQLQGLEEEFIFSPSFVKSHYDQVSSWTSHFPSTSNEQINTESDGEDYRLLETTSDTQTLAAVNLDCSVANSMGSLVCHMKMHAKDADDSGVCEKNFHSTESMQDHLQTHIDTRFSCDVCSKCFTMSSKLKMHMRCHRRNLLPCPFCGKYSNSAANLKVHIRTHTGEKPYQCRDCVKCFSCKSNLKKHIRCHTGEKPYHCPDCGKGFTQSAHMGMHMRIHTGEKPHSCSVCGRSFSNGPHLKVHMRTHTGEKPYNCSLCDKCFSSHSGLTVHTRTHTGEKPYICPLCKKGFTSASNLKAHKKRHTKSKNRVGVMVVANASLQRSPNEGISGNK